MNVTKAASPASLAAAKASSIRPPIPRSISAEARVSAEATMLRLVVVCCCCAVAVVVVVLAAAVTDGDERDANEEEDVKATDDAGRTETQLNQVM